MKPTPSSAPQHAGLAVTFFAMAAIGWTVGGGPSPEPAVTGGETPPERAARMPVREASRFGVPVSAKSQVAGIKSLRTPEERMRATIHLASTLSPRQLLEWLEGRWFEMSGGYDLSLFNKIAKERLRAEDPRLFLKWALAEESEAGSLVADLASVDPDYVLECISDMPLNWRVAEMLGSLAKSNPALALRAFQELRMKANPHDSSGHYRMQILSELAKSSPQTLAAAMDSFDAADRRQAEVALLRESLSHSFETEIRKLWDRPDGWILFRDSYSSQQELGNKLLAELGNLPASWRARLAQQHHGFINQQNARQWWNLDYQKLGFTKEQEQQFKRTAVSSIGYQEPEEAIRLMATLELEDHQRSDMIRNLIFNQRHRDAERAERLLAMLPSGTERDELAELISKRTSQGAVTVPDSPSEWLKEVASLGSTNGSTWTFTSALRQWDQAKLDELTTGFRSLPPDEKGAVATTLSENVQNFTLRGEAISYLVANPPEEGTPGHSNVTSRASTFAADWGRTDPEGATQWVQSLPPGEPKLWAQRNLALAWSEYDPQEAGRWMNRLPTEERRQVEEFLKNPGMR